MGFLGVVFFKESDGVVVGAEADAFLSDLVGDDPIAIFTVELELGIGLEIFFLATRPWLWSIL